MEKQMLRLAQEQLGSANLEAKSLKELIKSFFGKVLQWVNYIQPVISKLYDYTAMSLSAKEFLGKKN
jgi:hypothetical protein